MRCDLLTLPLTVSLITLSACAEGPLHDSDIEPGSASDRANQASATSILNAGVMATARTQGEDSIKVLFDPLYDNHFGSLQELPADLAEAIITGTAPYDGVDLVFVSHAHGDHFSASMLTAMLAAQSGVQLVAPGQVIEAMRKENDWSADLEVKVRSIDLENGAATQTFELAGATITGLRSPHSGWPDRHSAVHNISYRVSVPTGNGEAMRVMHLGDADAADEHLAPFAEFFAAKRTGLVMVPFWFYQRDDWDAVRDETLNAQEAVAVHVPVRVPAALSEGARPYFTQVGEVVEIPLTAQDN